MDAMREYLLNLEELAWEANRKGDAGFYAAYLTEDALAVASRGRLDKAAVVATVSDCVTPPPPAGGRCRRLAAREAAAEHTESGS